MEFHNNDDQEDVNENNNDVGSNLFVKDVKNETFAICKRTMAMSEST